MTQASKELTKAEKAMDKVEVLGTKVDATKANTKAKELVLRAEQTYMQLAETLAEIRDKKLFLKLDDKDGKPYQSFETYVEHELNMAGRKAWYLLNVHDKMIVDLKIPKARLEEISFSKAREIVSVIDEAKDAEFWIEKAKVTDYPQLLKEVQDERRKTGVSKKGEITYKLNFTLFEDQYKNWEQAKKQAAKDAESDKEGHLFDLILTSYLAGEALSKDVDDAGLKRIFNSLERVYGISLMAVKDEGDEIIYQSKKMARKLSDK